MQADGLASGDLIEIIPFWTLTTLFPNGTGIDATTDSNVFKTQVLEMPRATVGTNLSAQAVHLYFSGPGLPAGWYDTGDGTLSNDRYFVPDSYVIIRNPGVARAISISGEVTVGSAATLVGNLAPAQAQDNLVVNPFPVPLTLAQLNLVQSGAIQPTTDFNNFKDLLLLYSPSVTGYNQAASKVLIYWTGGQGLANGWYDTGTGQGPLDTTETIPLGIGFVIRKPAAAQAAFTRWTAPAPY